MRHLTLGLGGLVLRAPGSLGCHLGPYGRPPLGLGPSQSPKAYEFRGALGPRATSHEFGEQPLLSLGSNLPSFLPSLRPSFLPSFLPSLAPLLKILP